MKRILALLACIALAGCEPADEDSKPVEPLTQPYAEKIEQLEQQDIQRVEDQLETVDMQSGDGNHDDGL